MAIQNAIIAGMLYGVQGVEIQEAEARLLLALKYKDTVVSMVRTKIAQLKVLDEIIDKYGTNLGETIGTIDGDEDGSIKSSIEDKVGKIIGTSDDAVDNNDIYTVWEMHNQLTQELYGDGESKTFEGENGTQEAREILERNNWKECGLKTFYAAIIKVITDDEAMITNVIKDLKKLGGSSVPNDTGNDQIQIDKLITRLNSVLASVNKDQFSPVYDSNGVFETDEFPSHDCNA